MDRKILRDNGPVKVEIKVDKYGCEFSTTRNGHHWTGQTMTPELARLSIEALQEYLNP